jgi:hypothetical protein
LNALKVVRVPFQRLNQATCSKWDILFANVGFVTFATNCDNSGGRSHIIQIAIFIGCVKVKATDAALQAIGYNHAFLKRCPQAGHFLFIKIHVQ